MEYVRNQALNTTVKVCDKVKDGTAVARGDPWCAAVRSGELWCVVGELIRTCFDVVQQHVAHFFHDLAFDTARVLFALLRHVAHR